MPRVILAAVLIVAALAPCVNGQTLQWSGFGLLRGAETSEDLPFPDDQLFSQLQIGLDWTPSLNFQAHLHGVARSDPHGSTRGAVGLTQAYLELNLPRGQDRLRILAGAFFLPSSRENVDALWESPYAITSSALNSWFGEEFRPIGVDLSYTARRVFTIGGTVFRGNDTFGALPVDRGWAIHDRWTLLGEHLPTNEEYSTSISAENDGRLGWSGRTRWQNQYATLQFTRIDNRSDGLEYPGHLFNWVTRFSLAGAELSWNDWTLATEGGWGTTSLTVHGMTFPSDIEASYVLLSRRIARARATVRYDWFGVDGNDDDAVTAAFFWSPRGPWRAGLEFGSSDDERRRFLVELRYHFSSE